MRSLLLFFLPLVSLAQPPADFDLHWLDTAAFAQRIEDVQLIGLGEATHGTREIYQLRHALTAHLIERQQVRLILIEGGNLRCEPLNRYLQGETITLDSALFATSRWMWQTESVRQMMTWLRAYNQGQSPAERVRLYGVDQDHYDASGERLMMAIAQLPDGDSLRRSLQRKLELDTSASAFQRVRNMEKKAVKARLAYLDSLETLLYSLNPDAFSAAQQLALREARYHAHNLAGVWRYAEASLHGSYGGYLEVRDPEMAHNIRWRMAKLAPGQRAVFWAHNEHIEHGAINFSGAGMYLREALGEAYYALAISAGPGHCLVSKAGTGAFHQPVYRHRRGLEHHLGAAVQDTLWVDFQTDFGQKLASQPLHLTHIPAMPVSRRGSFMKLRMGEHFDGVCFVPESEPTVWVEPQPH